MSQWQNILEVTQVMQSNIWMLGVAEVAFWLVTQIMILNVLFVHVLYKCKNTQHRQKPWLQNDRQKPWLQMMSVYNNFR